MRRGLRAVLATRQGWKVCGEARAGAEAVDLVKRLKPDILVMDISMPETNGFEALRQIHAFDPNIGILMLTMHDSEPMLRDAIEARARAYILKSDPENRLIGAVEALRASRAFFSSSISEVIRRSYIKGAAGAQPGRQAPSPLTPRQREVLKLLASGKSNKEVANKLGISVRTAETHRQQIMARLKVRTMSELVLFAVRNHLIEV